ncbi:MAG TPA: alkaline phosphatase family protein [Candidatus Dormibacteraeota bacterium]|nr:alkaline phosphatase family protein [Candidatus Dormibacteraeota bacterium]
MSAVTRRCLVASLFIVLTASYGPAFAKGRDKSLPPASRSGIEHIIVVMMENRSFDHFLGWLPNADGMQAGLSYTDETGASYPTAPLAPDYMGCAHPDPDHSWMGGRVEYDNGAMDGFLRAGMNDQYAIGYYTEADRPFFNAFARAYTTCDHFFASILGPTYPNRIFQHAAQTDRLDNTLDISTLPTIWDRLAEEGVSARYYFSDVPFLLLWGGKYVPISGTYDEFLADAAAGTLPSVAFVDPRFVNDETGTSGSDHPHADVRVGDAFLAETFQAVANSPNWSSTVFIVTYDEWGGFFDHVAPPRADAPNDVDPDLVGGKALLGLRVPVVVASPFTRGDSANPRVVSTVFDHTSVLKLIEWRYHLRPLTARDASDDVGNLVQALDFTHRDASVPPLPVPSPPLIVPCLTGVPPSDLPVEAVQLLAPQP